MCLLLSHLKPKIADKDIVCYKLVKRTKIKGIYKSSFKGFEYIIRRLYINNINIKFSNSVIKQFKIHCVRVPDYYIEENMFHSYVFCPYPIKLLHNEVLVKCIIPKGAYYFEDYLHNEPNYASSQIKILEEI